MRNLVGASPKYEVLGNAATGRDKEDAAMPRTSSAQKMPRQTRRGVELLVETARELAFYQAILDDMALDLFEVSPEARQFLPQR